MTTTTYPSSGQNPEHKIQVYTQANIHDEAHQKSQPASHLAAPHPKFRSQVDTKQPVASGRHGAPFPNGSRKTTSGVQFGEKKWAHVRRQSGSNMVMMAAAGRNGAHEKENAAVAMDSARGSVTRSRFFGGPAGLA